MEVARGQPWRARTLSCQAWSNTWVGKMAPKAGGRGRPKIWRRIWTGIGAAGAFRCTRTGFRSPESREDSAHRTCRWAGSARDREMVLEGRWLRAMIPCACSHPTNEVRWPPSPGLLEERVCKHMCTSGRVSVSLPAKLTVLPCQALMAASAFVSKKQLSKVDAFLQAPFTGAYTSQAGEVVGILKDPAQRGTRWSAVALCAASVDGSPHRFCPPFVLRSCTHTALTQACASNIFDV